MNAIQTFWPAATFVAVSACLLWIVWRALASGVINIGGSVWRQRDEPILFWFWTGMFVLFLVLIAAGLDILGSDGVITR